MSRANVLYAYPHATASRNYLEGGWYVTRFGKGHVGTVELGGFLGEGMTEEEAWDDAARNMLASSLGV